MDLSQERKSSCNAIINVHFVYGFGSEYIIYGFDRDRNFSTRSVFGLLCHPINMFFIEKHSSAISGNEGAIIRKRFEDKTSICLAIKEKNN